MNNSIFPIAYACYSKNEAVRIRSSSGGIFYMLGEEVLGTGGVVFGAAFDSDWSVKHRHVDSKDELILLMGSKYIQSNIGDTYKQVKCFLKNGRQVLFCGTPCQIAGLKRFLNRNYDNLILVDFICHGVASPEVWKQYLDEISEGKEIESISFRDKTRGWSKFSLKIKYRDGTEYLESPYIDPFMRAFLKDIIQRPACYQCRFKGLERESDMTLADFWGIKNILPHSNGVRPH